MYLDSSATEEFLGEVSRPKRLSSASRIPRMHFSVRKAMRAMRGRDFGFGSGVRTAHYSDPR